MPYVLGLGDVIRPNLRPVQQALDTDHSRHDHISRDIERSWNQQFARSRDAPRPAALGKFDQPSNRRRNLFVDTNRGARGLSASI